MNFTFHLIFATDWECVILENDETDPVSFDTLAQLHFFHHEDTHAHNNTLSFFALLTYGTIYEKRPLKQKT